MSRENVILIGFMGAGKTEWDRPWQRLPAGRCWIQTA